MKIFGQGYCTSGYYAGWDGKGLESQNDCNTVCLEEAECTYAAWDEGKTCSRYHDVDCKMNKNQRDYENHVTFKKVQLGKFKDTHA